MGLVNKKTRLYLRSMGCKVNMADAASVIGRLDPDQVELVTDPVLADLALVNTCTVTHKADRDVRKILSGLARENPALRVVVSGCAAVTCRETLAECGNVIRSIPPGEPAAVVSALGLRERAAQAGKGESSFQWLGRQRAFVKVQDGCDACCAYCVIPSVRGRPRSLPIDEAVAAVGAHLAHGHREVVLAGIHLGRYGRDRDDGAGLARLLTLLSAPFASAAGSRLRLSSIEPLEWSGDLLSAIEDSEFICRHFHVPMQSGDDRVLGAMGRPYKVSQYARCVEDLRQRFPDAAIGADVLVGFPGESEEQAANTLALAASLPLSYLHVFTFSARPHTRAAEMAGQVEPETKKRRAAELRQVAKQSWLDFLNQGLGVQHQVLIERVQPDWAMGRSEHYRPVRIPNAGFEKGQLLTVHGLEVDEDCLTGQARSDAGLRAVEGGEACRPA